MKIPTVVRLIDDGSHIDDHACYKAIIHSTIIAESLIHGCSNWFTKGETTPDFFTPILFNRAGLTYLPERTILNWL
jgi:hypothetical protein